jgi:hypothetical protein
MPNPKGINGKRQRTEEEKRVERLKRWARAEERSRWMGTHALCAWLDLREPPRNYTVDSRFSFDEPWFQGYYLFFEESNHEAMQLDGVVIRPVRCAWKSSVVVYFSHLYYCEVCGNTHQGEDFAQWEFRRLGEKACSFNCALVLDARIDKEWRRKLRKCRQEQRMEKDFKENRRLIKQLHKEIQNVRKHSVN